MPCAVDGYLLFQTQALHGTGVVYEGVVYEDGVARIPDASGWATELTPELLEPILADQPARTLD